MASIDIAEVALSNAMRRVENAAQNLANMTTPGFKAHRAFPLLLQGSEQRTAVQPSAIDFSEGKLQQTGNPFDLAISGEGFFEVHSSDGGVFYTRNGQFHRDEDNNLVTTDGFAVQSAAGDLQLESGAFTVQSDGTLLQNGEPVAKLAIARFDDPSGLQSAGANLYTAPEGSAQEITDAQVHQGMIETSNVTTADEMLAIMAALRSAESSQKTVQVYDDLMGKVLTAFGS